MRRCLFALLLALLLIPTAAQAAVTEDGLWYAEPDEFRETAETVSLLADEEGMYTVTVSLPQDLRTSYGKRLDFGGELAGTAQILADERSVTARLLSPLRYLWEKYR